MHKDQGSGKRKEFATLRRSIMIEEETIADKDNFDDIKLLDRHVYGFKSIFTGLVSIYKQTTEYILKQSSELNFDLSGLFCMLRLTKSHWETYSKVIPTLLLFMTLPMPDARKLMFWDFTMACFWFPWGKKS